MRASKSFGKSTIANLVERRLYEAGRHTYLLDGDNVRQGLNRDLGFTETDRVENIRRVAKGLYAKARAGRLKNFTGIDSPYQPPDAPEIRIVTTGRLPAECAEEVCRRLL